MSVTDKILKFITSGNSFLILGVLLNVLVHLPFMNQPPSSQHVWRQSNTLAVARNFYEEEMDIFHTRVDHRKNTNGITGSHFASYEFILAGLYKIFGEKFWVHRCLSMVIFLWGAFGFLYLFRILTGNELIARFGFWTSLFCPELFYYQINALPDILALSASVWGFYYFVKWFNGYAAEGGKNDILSWLLALFFIALAGLTKLQYLAIGFPIGVYVLLHLRKITGLAFVLMLVVLGLCSVFIPLLWYKRAIDLIESSGLADFGLEIRSELHLGKAISIIKRNLLSDLPEMILNYAAFILLLIGIYFAFRKKPRVSGWYFPFLVYAAGLLTYHILELRQMDVHGYYMMPYYPVLLLLVGFGAYKLLEARKFILLFILLFAQPVLATIRIVPARWLNKDRKVPVELYAEESRQRLIQAVPDKAITVVGPDPSNCIYFYYLHKKGYSFNSGESLFEVNPNGNTNLEEYIHGGATYLYVNSEKAGPAFEQKMQAYGDKILTEGVFQVYKLRKN